MDYRICTRLCAVIENDVNTVKTSYSVYQFPHRFFFFFFLLRTNRASRKGALDVCPTLVRSFALVASRSVRPLLHGRCATLTLDSREDRRREQLSAADKRCYQSETVQKRGAQ